MGVVHYNYKLTRGRFTIDINSNIHSMFDTYPDVVNAKELQEMLRIGRNQTYKLLENGNIQSFKIGKKYLISKMKIIDYICYNGRVDSRLSVNKEAIRI